jgi:hypothetical protein
MAYIKYVPVPVPVEVPSYPEKLPCKVCPECNIVPGIIAGCIEGCNCCTIHEWEIRLYRICSGTKILMFCELSACCDSFRFEVPCKGNYILEICPSGFYKKTSVCRPVVCLKNVGVTNLNLCF